MTLSVDDAKALVIEFCAIYPVASTISYKLRATQEELYGPQATREAVGGILGSFRPGSRQADFATSNFRNEDEFKETRSEEHTSELQSPCNLVCRLLLEKKNKKDI